MARRSMILKRGSVMNESQREGENFSERPILELERGCSKILWGLGSKCQARESTKLCWGENEGQQCDQKLLALMNDFVVLGLY